MSIPNDKTTIFIRNIPPKIKREFKILCLKKNVTMQDKIVSLIQEEVDRSKGKKRDPAA